jgi:hypothetical protein
MARDALPRDAYPSQEGFIVLVIAVKLPSGLHTILVMLACPLFILKKGQKEKDRKSRNRKTKQGRK